MACLCNQRASALPVWLSGLPRDDSYHHMESYSWSKGVGTNEALTTKYNPEPKRFPFFWNDLSLFQIFFSTFSDFSPLVRIWRDPRFLIEVVQFSDKHVGEPANRFDEFG